MDIVRRSLALKLLLAFLLVSIIGVALTALLARWATYQEFEQMVLERTREDYVDRVTAYYEEHGSWAGVAQITRRPPQPMPQNPDQATPQSPNLLHSDRTKANS